MTGSPQLLVKELERGWWPMDGSGDSVLWHELECGAYAADLELWRGLARAAAGEVLQIGCGSGRLALRLAREGHEVTGIDLNPMLVSRLNRRAAVDGLPARAIEGDARHFCLDRSFSLTVGAMQVVQLLGGSEARTAMLRCVHDHMEPGGVLALALCDPVGEWRASGDGQPVPDMLDRDGWVYSSLPLAVRRDNGSWLLERLRQSISPAGRLVEAMATTRLDRLSPSVLEEEAASCGLRPSGRFEIAATDLHIGSTVVALERPR